MKCVGISFNADGGSCNFGIEHEDVFVDNSKVTIDNMMEMYKDKFFYYTLNKSLGDRGKETYGKFKKTNFSHDLLYWVTDEKELSEMSDLIHDCVVREEKKSGQRNDWYWDKSPEMKLLRRDSSLYKIEVDG
jgi:hypothetical protein